MADAERVEEARERRVLALLERVDQVAARSCRPCARARRAWRRRACTGRAACGRGRRRRAGRPACRPGPRCPSRAGRRSAGAPACAARRRTGRRVQRRSTSPFSRTTSLPQTGHWRGMRKFGTSPVRLPGHDADDLGDHVAGAAHDHRVADAHVLAAHLVHVVQRGVADRRAADEHRLQLGHRRELAGAADLDVDAEQLRHLLLRRVLVRHRPARLARHEAEPLLQRELVDLVDHAVDVERQRVALGARSLRRTRPGPRRRCTTARSSLDRQAQPRQRVEQRRCAWPARPSPAPRRGRRRRSVSGRCARDRRVELAHRAGGGVARVDEGLRARPRAAAR